ncbi:MAG TPA: hypothetical protein VGC79_06455, partial [Polyangiaceae bacterium]
PAMLSVAQRQRATLLPDQPLGLGLTPLCQATQVTASRTDGYCVLDSEAVLSATGGLGDAYQLLDHEGKRLIAIPIGWAVSGARLARRENTLFLLTPAVTLHQVDERVQCVCKGGPVIVSMSGYVNLGSAFVIHDLPEVAIQQIVVPVVDDYVEWHCKAILVRNDHAPHSAVASAGPRADAAASGCSWSRPESPAPASRQ